MNILNTIAAKIMGVSTISELADRKLGVMLHINGLENSQLKMYKVDRDSMDPRFYERVYVGTAQKGGKQVGIILEYSEGTGYIYGHIVNTQKIDQHAKMVMDHLAYCRSPDSRTYGPRRLYSHFLFELGEIEELKQPQ